MIEFRKLGGERGIEEEKKKSESLNFRRGKFKDLRGRKGNLKWNLKKIHAHQMKQSTPYIHKIGPPRCHHKAKWEVCCICSSKSRKGKKHCGKSRGDTKIQTNIRFRNDSK